MTSATKPHYRFTLRCPRCQKVSETTVPMIERASMVPFPKVNCGDCLMNDVEVVEFEVIQVVEVL